MGSNVARSSFTRRRTSSFVRGSANSRGQGVSRGVIALPDLCPVTRLRGQLERGLEEIHEQPDRDIQSRQRSRGFQTFEAAVADHAAHDSAILLIYPSLVVLAIGTVARELDPDLLAIIPKGLVHEHAVVVDIQTEQRDGAAACVIRLAPPSAAVVRAPASAHTRSARGDVSQRQRHMGETPSPPRTHPESDHAQPGLPAHTARQSLPPTRHAPTC